MLVIYADITRDKYKGGCELLCCREHPDAIPRRGDKVLIDNKLYVVGHILWDMSGPGPYKIYVDLEPGDQ